MQNQLQVCTKRLQRVNKILKFSGPIWYLYSQLVRLQKYTYTTEVKVAMTGSSLKQTSRDLQLQIYLLHEALNYTPGVKKLWLKLELNTGLKE